ncbi:MAG: hypothetical protein RIQ62_1024 [Bacteroidota bacterium]|jgi:hypothetical protein
MKKVLFLALGLLVAGTMYADKKCCKDKSSCSKSEAKHCSHDEAKAEGSEAAAGEMHACCKKSMAAGGKACCAKGGAHSEAAPQAAPQDSKAPARDDAPKR